MSPDALALHSTGPRTLPLEAIRADGGTQPREAIDDATVAEYAEALQAGATFPPVSVYYDGESYWLADGFHRLAAYDAAGHTAIPVHLYQGTRRDAVLFSVGANAQHGLRRTNADKRRAVTTLLRDEEWGKLSNRQVAEYARVSDRFVGIVRDELEESGDVRTVRTRTDSLGREQPARKAPATTAGDVLTVNTSPLTDPFDDPELRELEEMLSIGADPGEAEEIRADVAAAAAEAEPADPEAYDPEADFDEEDELLHALEENQRLERENDELRRALEASDLGAELLKAREEIVRLRGHANGQLTTINELKKQARYQTGKLKKVREMLGVERDGQIEAALLALLQRAGR